MKSPYKIQEIFSEDGGGLLWSLTRKDGGILAPDGTTSYNFGSSQKAAAALRDFNRLHRRANDPSYIEEKRQRLADIFAVYQGLSRDRKDPFGDTCWQLELDQKTVRDAIEAHWTGSLRPPPV